MTLVIDHMAVQQVVVTGDDAQVDAARTILDNARKNIYPLLAGDTPNQQS